MSSDDGDLENQAELEEKTRLINQVLELQHTLEDLSARVDAVKEENLKLKSENQVLGQYIENLMSASSVFQTTDTKSKRNTMTHLHPSTTSTINTRLSPIRPSDQKSPFHPDLPIFELHSPSPPPPSRHWGEDSFNWKHLKPMGRFHGDPLPVGVCSFGSQSHFI
ncbi:uncharacterized protein [Trachinotus anak]|uniref:uncharacterized protein isoform X1 n=1 Tax=Trachinotus anak TaxID=443729 RepID=UPI0039F1A970